MCVIIFKPANKSLPNKNILIAAARQNPHGCGIVTPSMFFKTASSQQGRELLKQIDESEPCLIHFRYATHGSIKVSNCHPFYDSKTGVYFMHNGVLPIDSINDQTDSEICFNSILKPALKFGIDSNQLKQKIDTVIGASRFAFMQGDKVALYGNFLEYDGCYFSNIRPLPTDLRNMILTN